MPIVMPVSKTPAYGEPGTSYYREAYDPAEDPRCHLGTTSVYGNKEVPQWYRTTYEGAVIATGEINQRDDSDFYAVVWDGEKLQRVTYDTTRFAGGGSAIVDVTPENFKAVQEYTARLISAARIRKDIEQSKEVKIGRQAIVARGTNRQKAKPGTVGEVLDIDVRKSLYGTWTQSVRVQLGYGEKGSVPYTLTTADDKVILSSPYNPYFPRKARSIGGDWNKSDKVWEFPVDVDMALLQGFLDEYYPASYTNRVWVNMDNVDVVDPDQYRALTDDYTYDPNDVTLHTTRAVTGVGLMVI
jgi:hypothetical protein